MGMSVRDCLIFTDVERVSLVVTALQWLTLFLGEVLDCIRVEKPSWTRECASTLSVDVTSGFKFLL